MGMDGGFSSWAGSFWQPVISPFLLLDAPHYWWGLYKAEFAGFAFPSYLIDILRTHTYRHHKSYPRYGMPEPSWLRVCPLMGD